MSVLGNEHNISFMVCARLWPATPQYPRLAFCFELLDWAKALLLECQVHGHLFFGNQTSADEFVSASNALDETAVWDPCNCLFPNRTSIERTDFYE